MHVDFFLCNVMSFDTYGNDLYVAKSGGKDILKYNSGTTAWSNIINISNYNITNYDDISIEVLSTDDPDQGPDTYVFIADSTTEHIYKFKESTGESLILFFTLRGAFETSELNDAISSLGSTTQSATSSSVSSAMR